LFKISVSFRRVNGRNTLGVVGIFSSNCCAYHIVCKLFSSSFKALEKKEKQLNNNTVCSVDNVLPPKDMF
jgi:hypothetical protein